MLSPGFQDRPHYGAPSLRAWPCLGGHVLAEKLPSLGDLSAKTPRDPGAFVGCSFADMRLLTFGLMESLSYPR